MFGIFFVLLMLKSDLISVEAVLSQAESSVISILRSDSLSGEGYKWMSNVCDDFGPRLAGSQNLEDAIDSIVQQLKIFGFDAVHTEPVTGIPYFLRSKEDRVTVLDPRKTALNMLAIPGTSTGRIKAEAIVLEDISELQTTDVHGKIVVFAQKWQGYSITQQYRKAGDRAARRGAVGLLVKSVTPSNGAEVHTGMGVNTTIPCASISASGSELLLRWQKSGRRIVIEMDIKSDWAPFPAISRNTVFDIKGSEKPSEIVLISAHLDSWDVGQGALDDAGGCAATLSAMRAIKQLIEGNPYLRPKRTIRCVFWTAEEQGLIGAHQYFMDHINFRYGEKFVFVSETDQGAFRPLNDSSWLAVKGDAQQMNKMRSLASDMRPHGITLGVLYSGGQNDVQDFADSGVLSMLYVADRSFHHYFNFHHAANSKSSRRVHKLACKNGDAVHIPRVVSYRNLDDNVNQLEPRDIDEVAAIFGVAALRMANLQSI